MIRLKQSMGSGIKCKIDSEDMISKYECSVLEDNRLNSLFNMQIEKSTTIVYSDDVKKRLIDIMNSSIEEEAVESYLCQSARVISDIKKMGLNPEKLILNPEWIYLSRDEKTLKFIYCPVNGMIGRYDGILFMRDFLLSAPLSKNVRDKWKQWLDSVTKTGITEQAVKKIEKADKDTRGLSNGSTSVFDEDGEPLTGLGDDVWRSYDSEEGMSQVMRPVDEIEEPATGIDEDESIWSASSAFYEQGFEHHADEYTSVSENHNYYDDDGEAPTGVEDCFVPEPQKLQENVAARPTLVRVNTGERVTISSDNFKLGRSEQRADFCIRNNSGISNIHATVMYKNGQYFLKDNYSTNGTYVNGNKILDSSVPVLLRDGNVIQLYNEEIVFNV